MVLSSPYFCWKTSNVIMCEIAWNFLVLVAIAFAAYYFINSKRKRLRV